jgi:serine/threonine protein kinase/WD40 repeat protein
MSNPPNSSASGSSRLDELAEEFARRYQQGERPALSEYTARYPELADQIRELFPALALLQQVRPEPGAATGPYEPGRPGAGGARLERLGDYRILREVGRGGMGIVYEAEQESLGRHVALKVLPAHALLDAARLQRLQREAKAAARLHHTNIVPVYGVGEHEGLHYYVMQFIQGLALDEVLAELTRLRQARQAPETAAAGPLPAPGSEVSAVAQALLTRHFGRSGADPADSAEGDVARPSPAQGVPPDSSLRLPGSGPSSLSESGRAYWQSVAHLGIQVAEALAYAHAQGTLHRDIKPSNLLLDTHGIVWVTDFGLAKAADSDDLTNTGDLVGTLRYMAPERFAGQSEPRSDLYGLGLTLYELLTLRPAFEATDRNRLIAQVQHEEPPRPRKLSGAVPRDLETIVLKAMAKEPAHRYASAAALAEDLRRFVEDKPIRARPVGNVERLWRWCRRNPIVASLTGAVAVLLVAVAVVSVVAAVHLSTARNEADYQAEVARGHAQEAKQAQEQEADHRRLAEGRLARQYVSNGAQALERGDLFDALPWFLEALKIEKDDPKRAEMHLIRLHTVLQQSPRVQLFFKDGPPKAVGFSQDYSGTVTASDRSADGRRIVKVQNRDRLELLGPCTLGLAASPLGQGALVAAALGCRTKSARLHSEAQVWDVATGRAVTPPLKYDGAGGLLKAFFSPDGRRVYTAGCRWITAENRMEIEEQIWDAVTGQPLTPLLKRAGAAAASVDFDAVFSPNGKCVFSRGDARIGYDIRPLNPRMWVWDATTGQIIWSPHAHEHEANRVQFSPDGLRLLVEYRRGQGVQLWDIASRKPIGERIGTRSYFFGTLGRFSRDGRRVLTRRTGKWGDPHEIQVWEAETAKPISPPIRIDLLAVESWHTEQSFSPDGSRILGALQQREVQGEVRVWDAATGRAITPRLPFEGRIARAAFSSDGRHILVVGEDGKGRSWDLATARYAGSSPGPGMRVSHPALSPDGRRTVSLVGQGVQLWDTITGQPAGPVFRINPVKANGPYSYPWNRVHFSPDGRLILAGGQRGLIGESPWPDTVDEARVLDAATGRPITPRLKPGGGIMRADFSPDSKRVLFAIRKRPNEEDEIQVWDVMSGRLAWPPLKPGGWVFGHPFATFSPNGRYLVTTTDKDKSVQIRIWDAAAGEAITPPISFEECSIRVAISPDGRRLAAALVGDISSGDEVRAWDVTKAQPLFPPLKFQSHINEVAISHDGARFATASEDATARVWITATGKAGTPPLRHEAKVLHAEFSPDGRRLLTATEWAVRIWDAATGEPLTPALRPGSHISAAAFLPEPLLSDPSLGYRYGDLEWPGSRVNVATFSSDGRHVLVLNDANQVRVWDLSPDNRSVDDLERLVTLLSGRRIDATGTSVPSAASESDWQQLKAAYPEAFTVPEQQVSAWRQAEEQEKERARKAAPELYANRGQAYAERDRLAEAAADLARAIELGHDDVWTWTTLALVRLARKDDTGYRHARRHAETLRQNRGRQHGPRFHLELRPCSGHRDRAKADHGAGPTGCCEGPGQLVLRGHVRPAPLPGRPV